MIKVSFLFSILPLSKAEHPYPLFIVLRNKSKSEQLTALLLSEMTNINQSQYSPFNPYQSAKKPPVQQNPANFVPPEYRTSVHDDVRLSFAGDLNPLIFKDHEWHIRSLIATIILLIGIIVPLCIWIWIPQDFTMTMAIAVFVSAYILYLLIGCICNQLHEYLRNMQQGQYFQNEYNRIRGLFGQFGFTAQCYHYETRYHTRHITQNGYTRTETYTTQDKVVSHTANQVIVPAYTSDESGNVDRIRSDKNIVFIHFIVNYKFSNDYSRNKIDELYYAFKCANTRDSYQNFAMLYNIPNLVEKMTFYVGDLGCNYNCWYYVFTIFGLLWPYSIWVESKISRFDVAFMKVVTM